MPESANLVTKSGYARHRGVSPALITRWTKAGRIVLVDGKVDLLASDARLAESLDPARGGRRDRGGSGTAEPISAIAKHTAEGRDYSARLKRLEYEERAGNLVPRKAVEAAAFNNADAARGMLERIPDRVAARLAAETDARKVRALLIAEIEAVCIEIGSNAKALPGNLAVRQ